jgi:CRP/FNR family cyclic AMP-dependent transcriptional regulator
MPVKISQLQEYTCFQSISEDQLESIRHIADIVLYPPGHTLFEEGEYGGSIYFLIRGEVDLFFNIGEGGPFQVDQIYPEELVGCATLIPPYRYTSTAQSQTEIEVLKIDAEALRTLMKENCLLGFTVQQNMIQMLMDRITNFRLG